MLRSRTLVVSALSIAVLCSCGQDPTPDESGSFARLLQTLPTVPSSGEEGVVDAAAESPVVEPGRSSRPQLPQQEVPAARAMELDQPAIWPAADVVFDTPEAAAADFVSTVLGVEPVLGEFQAGDARSGEMQVFSPGEDGSGPLLERGLLGLRMIGPSDGWFVIGASSDGVTISQPEASATTPAGPLLVAGRGCGFEGTLVVRAFSAGDVGDHLDQVITSGGAFEALEPYEVTLDLTTAEPGDVIAIVVRGDTGLGSDPGDFASTLVMVGESLPATR